MKKFVLLFLFSYSYLAFGQADDSAVIARLSHHILTHGECYNDLRVLTKQIGHRISGSPAAERAVSWGVQTLKAAGADSVWLQPVIVPVWVRGEEYLRLQLHGDAYTEVKVLSLGNTVGTKGKELQLPVVYVATMEQAAALTNEEVQGKIVFYNYKWRQDLVSSFEAYSDAVRYRWQAVNQAAAKGAAAVIIRSVGSGLDDEPHTGATHYDAGGRRIPAVAIGASTADLLEEACSNATVHAQMMTNSDMHGTAMSYNVIAELRGSTVPKEYVLVGGHLDSWDVGEGAHDDGAGCVQSIEVLRSFRRLGIRPKRTLRVVLFMNEENGMKGALAYADSAQARGERHIMAMESDAGGFSPRSIGLEMDAAQKRMVKGWQALFYPYGVYDFELEDGGVDIGPLARQGTALAGLLPDPQRYFDLHHSNKDVFEAVSHRELKLGAITMAAFVYMADKYFN